MGGTVEICPSCSAFVRHDWSDKCGSCGADLYPEVDGSDESNDLAGVEPVNKADKLNVPVFIGVAVIALLLCIGGLELIDSKADGDRRAKVELASGTAAANGSSTTLAAVATTTTTAAPSTTTQPAISDTEAMRRAADKWFKAKNFDFAMIATDATGTMTQEGSLDQTTGLFYGNVELPDMPKMEMILDPKTKTVYVKLPEEINPDPSKPWTKMINPAGINWTAASADDTEALMAATTNIHKSDTSSAVDGIPVTRYDFDIDKKIFTRDPRADEDYLKLAKKYTNGDFHGSLAVDGDGNVRQMKLFFGAGNSDDMTTIFTVRNLNNGKKIVIPSASETSSKQLTAKK